MDKPKLAGQAKFGQVYDLNEFRKNKPFFTKPMNITVGDNMLTETYFLLKNFVYQGKQILVLRNEQDPCTILLTEGEIENGKLKSLLKLQEDSLSEIKALFEGQKANTLIVDNN
ncbi:hypothetical protein [Bacillus marasmi]|uniref:hypothetical protein n=1 Tax=Bacillus marasmi TaxID=1926279 RepID=UPI0011CA2EF2|nr:hypothetical protein [Bacillus marasmi]